MKKLCTNILLIITVMLLLAACGQKEEPAESDYSESESADTSDEQTEPQEKVIGDFTAQTITGEEVTQEIFSEAELTMVNIWGTFCGPCINEMPELGELSRKYAERNVQIVGIIGDVSEPGDEAAQEIIDSAQADYVHIIASEDLQSGILSKVMVYPTTLFVDSEGNQVGEVYTGSKEQAAWELIIEKTLSEVH